MIGSKPRAIKASDRCLEKSTIEIAAACLLILGLLLTGTAQRRVSGSIPLRRKSSRRLVRQDSGINQRNELPWTGQKGVNRTTAEIMRAQAEAPPAVLHHLEPDREISILRIRPQDPAARVRASSTGLSKGNTVISAREAITQAGAQGITTNFNAVVAPSETSKYPPDTMGAIGPSQFLLAINGRLKTFNKTSGTPDGALNVSSDVFFDPVMSPFPAGGLNFTSDPQIRYDRLSGRWILIMIDLPSTSSSSIADLPNRVLIALTDAASSGVITGSTVWTMYFVQQDTVGVGFSNGEFLDYCSLGVDNNALYVGGVMYDAAAGLLKNTAGFVIRKSSILGGGPIVTTAFRDLVNSDGPNAPRGVDNYDPLSTEGYFIGVSHVALGRLIIRRVSDPGGIPSISANIAVAVDATSDPINVDHLGDGNGSDGDLDTLSDRLLAAHIRNGHLWTAHTNAVTSGGASSDTDPERRDGVRWYELKGVRSTDNGGVPVVVQSGTIFDSAATVASARQYWMPSVMVSGQGHVIIGFSSAGSPNHIDAAANGRLAGDAPGTTQAVMLYTSSSSAYNPSGDPGGENGRRWGDYSFTSLDPIDDMTIWTVQQYCSATDTYGLQVAKVVAPPPASPTTAAPSTVPISSPSINVIVLGPSISGSGFFDPGSNLPAPAVPFNHISATISGGVTVNSITYNNPNKVTINISTVGAAPGTKSITITNPDGQSATGSDLLNVVLPTATPASISGRITSQGGDPLSGVTMRLGGMSNSIAITDATGSYRFKNLSTGGFYTLKPEFANHNFSPAERSFSLVADKTDAVFTASLDSAMTANAIDTSEYFVRQHYLDFLGREPETGGLNFWDDQINQCHNDIDCVRARRIDVSAAFFNSQEFQDTGLFLFQVYQAALGRQIRYNEFMADRARVIPLPGQDVRQQFIESFVTQPEFVARYNEAVTGPAFVDAMIATIRNYCRLDLSNRRDALISNYELGTSEETSRSLVIREVIEEDIFATAVSNRSFVGMEYFGYLRRNPDVEGYNFWVNVLNSNSTDYRAMVCSFITSAEYQRRFSSVVTHNNAECSR